MRQVQGEQSPLSDKAKKLAGKEKGAWGQCNSAHE